MIGRDEWAKTLLDDFRRQILAATETATVTTTNNNTVNHTTTFVQQSSPVVHVLVSTECSSQCHCLHSRSFVCDLICYISSERIVVENPKQTRSTAIHFTLRKKNCEIRSTNKKNVGADVYPPKLNAALPV